MASYSGLNTDCEGQSVSDQLKRDKKKEMKAPLQVKREAGARSGAKLMLGSLSGGRSSIELSE